MRRPLVVLMCLFCLEYPRHLMADESQGELFPKEPFFRFGLQAISQIAYSPDGSILAVANDKWIGFYNGQTLAGVRVFGGHTDKVTSVAFSPNGKMIATGSVDKTVRLWDVEKQRETAILRGHTGGVTSVAFSPDGKLLASGGRGDFLFSDDNTVRLWDIVQGKEVATLKGHTNEITSVAFSPNGKFLASGSVDKTVRLWDIVQGKELAILKGHILAISSIAFSPDGKTLVSGGDDRIILQWDVEQQIQVGFFEGHSGEVASLTFSSDGKLLASGGGRYDNALRLWDVASKKIITLLGKYAFAARVVSVAFSPDNKTLASGITDNIVRLWDVSQRKEKNSLWGHTENVGSVTFSPNGKLLASAGEYPNYFDNSNVLVWDMEQLKLKLLFEDSAGPLAFSPDSKLLASSRNNDSYGNDGTMRLWDVAQGIVAAILQGHPSKGWISDIAFSPNGKLVAAGSTENTWVLIWEVNSQEIVKILKGHSSGVNSVAFSPDGKQLVSGSNDNSVRLWDVEKGQLVAILAGHTYWVTSVAFSPDGKLIASGGSDKTVRLWDIAKQKEIAIFPTNSDVTSIAFSYDGKLLASGSAGGILNPDSPIYLWDVVEHKEVAILTGHTRRVNSVAFSPYGKLLASGSEDGTVLLWGTRPQIVPPSISTVSLSLSSLKFDSTNVGAFSQKTFTISNMDSISLSITKIAVTGIDSLHFKVSPITATVVAGGNQIFTVTFSPTSAGSKSASLSIAHSAPGSPAMITLSGVAISATTPSGSAKNTVVPGGKFGAPYYTHSSLAVIRGITYTHPGVDIVADRGSPIYTFVDGKVTDAIRSDKDPDFRALGYMVIVKHKAAIKGKDTYSLYLHMQALPAVDIGQGVIGGQTILGKVDSTGAANGIPHVHFEVRHFSTRYLEDPGWNQPWNIYGKGDQRKEQRFLDNWEDPVVLFSQSPTQTSNPKLPSPDFDSSGDVNFDDFFLFASAFGQKATGAYLKFDLDSDGEIGFGDFFIFAGDFGKKVESVLPPTTGDNVLTATLPGGATMDFVWINPGKFLMGSPDSEPGRVSQEGPQHEVTITKGFYLGKYEVTQRQWQAVMGTTPWMGKEYVQVNPDNPAVYVSWDDAQALIKKLNDVEPGAGYRLPTEAEWEYACRAGTTTRWSFGDEESKLKDYTWYRVNTGDVGEEYAHKVGTKLANPWGLYDIHGNVWEWIQDLFGSYTSNPQTDPTGPLSGVPHVVRSGYFRYEARNVRSAVRFGGSPSDRVFSVGLRLLRQSK